MAKTRKVKRRKSRKVIEDDFDSDFLREEEETPKKTSKKKPSKNEAEGIPTYKNRYVASIQDGKENSRFYDFAESNSLSEIKQRCEKEVADSLKQGLNLGALILDRKEWFTYYRYNLPELPVIEATKGVKKVINDIETRVKSWVKDKN